MKEKLLGVSKVAQTNIITVVSKVNLTLKINPGDYVAVYQDPDGKIFIRKADIK